MNKLQSSLSAITHRLTTLEESVAANTDELQNVNYLVNAPRLTVLVYWRRSKRTKKKRRLLTVSVDTLTLTTVVSCVLPSFSEFGAHNSQGFEEQLKSKES